VRQIENRALNKLRKELSRRQGDEGVTQPQQIEAE
jgi:DNA-directed RNA polymerase sigma subunit (sigma70/sigma32)